MRAFLTLLVAASISCATPDAGAETVEAFFRDLEHGRFDAAADRVREDGGRPLSGTDRAVFIRGWRTAYEGYRVRFDEVVLRRAGAAPEHLIRGAGASEGWVYDVSFRGESGSPCVPVNSTVIPGTTKPIAIRLAGGWYLHREGVIGFVHTCPGG